MNNLRWETRARRVCRARSRLGGLEARFWTASNAEAWRKTIDPWLSASIFLLKRFRAGYLR